MAKRINRVIELLESGQPVYYTSTSVLTYENGREMCSTWADYIRLDLEHCPLDFSGVREFMKGLSDAGPTASGHPTPAVIAELPVDGVDGEVMRANAWMIKQMLAQGVHGLILCHAEDTDAARVFVESSRYPFHTAGVGDALGPGRRGHGGAKFAAEVWGVNSDEYLRLCDTWPLNPDGELFLGVKMENRRSVPKAEAITAVPGIAYGEWGSNDMHFSYGIAEKPEKPYPDHVQAARDRIYTACMNSGLHFLTIAEKKTLPKLLEEGIRIFRAYDHEIAEYGRKLTRRKMPW